MKKKIFVGITAPNSVDLIIGQLHYMQEEGYSVHLLAPDHPRVTSYCQKEMVSHIKVKIERKISPLKDIITLIVLVRLFLKEKPDVINLGTPKMSLLGMLAGFITRVPKRIYTCRGFRFEHEKGSLLRMLIVFEKVTSFCAHKVYCISKSVRDLGVNMQLFPIKKTHLIANGSSNGVDMNLFNPRLINKDKLSNLRNGYDLNDKFVYGFVGRLVDRKGINEMYEAFDSIYQQFSQVRLLVVGRPFWDQIKDAGIIEKLNSHPGIIMVGFKTIDQVPYFLSAMNVFLLPAHWEGFGNVLIQASAMGIPIIATDVTGCRDAVKDGFNGVLVPLYDHDFFVQEMEKMMIDTNRREQMGINGTYWSKNFKPEIIWHGLKKMYEEK